MPRPLKLSLWIVSIVLTVLLFAVGTVWWILAGSQAVLKGTISELNVGDKTYIHRDQQGLTTITAQSRADISFALGFTHAQERLFQMDLLRRNSAGELSELFGAPAANFDKRIRTHQFRKRSELALKALTSTEFGLLESYADGVNAGIEQMRAKPFEYQLLQTSPAPWVPADSFLVVYSMYMDLQDEWGEAERSLTALHDLIPNDWFNFLTPNGGEWDAPIDGKAMIFTAALPEKPLREFTQTESAQAYQYADEILPGSNNWSVSGAHTDHGGALVAVDMHLGLNVPNIWFRASWVLPEDGRQVTGATLPGAPLMVIGSNEHIAWGFTNSYADYLDIVRLQTNAEGTEYLTPDGWQPIIEEDEVILVKGEDPVTMQVLKTQWGPIIGEDHYGNSLAMRWVAHDKTGVNLNLSKLETADTVADAIAVASRAGIPGQNLNVGDRNGSIGWSIMGVLPNRVGFEHELAERLTQDWSDGTIHWDGLVPESDHPSVQGNEIERLWTANARVVSDTLYQQVGDGLGAIGARQQQIRDRLLEQELFTEEKFLALHLDDEARFLKRWHTLLSDTVNEFPLSEEPQLDDFREQLANWQGRASADSVGYLLVKRYRERVIDQTVGHIYRYVDEISGDFWSRKIDNRVEYAVWQLVTEQPERHVPAGYENWAQFLYSHAIELNFELADPETGLAEQTWGSNNIIKIQHPLSKAIPALSRFLDMPQQGLSGDTFMPRVQGQTFGASQRMAVSPGLEAQGYFHMATGQSGHPLSPFYGNGHNDWVEGTPSSFLPGETKYTLELEPNAN